jgi:RNA polymerase sigma-70 factor (ECF subfamily)
MSYSAYAFLHQPFDQTLQAARRGDTNAFIGLMEMYRGAATRLAQQILHTEEAATDAVQESLIKAYQAMARFEEGNFRSWWLRIVANTCYDYLRRQKRRPSISLDALLEHSEEEANYEGLGNQKQTAENPEQMIVQQETLQLVYAAIDDLPSWHRTVILLIDVHGYDYGEAAHLLQVPLGTVKSRLSRARATLRDRLVQLQMWQ